MTAPSSQRGRRRRRVAASVAFAIATCGITASAASAGSWDHGPWTVTPTPYTFLSEHTQVQSTIGNIEWMLRNDNPHSYGVRAMKCDGTTGISDYRDEGAHEQYYRFPLATSVVANTCFRERAYSRYAGNEDLYPTIYTT